MVVNLFPPSIRTGLKVKLFVLMVVSDVTDGTGDDIAMLFSRVGFRSTKASGATQCIYKADLIGFLCTKGQK